MAEYRGECGGRLFRFNPGQDRRIFSLLNVTSAQMRAGDWREPDNRSV